MSGSFPTETRVIIVGGGIIGCSVAYHLALLGCRDVVLLEQNRLAGGTTWHAAGLIGRLRQTSVLTRINQYSAELYSRLERETGHPVGWKQVGSLIAAASEDRMVQLRRTAAMSEWLGVEVQLISAEETRARWPLMRTDDLLGAAWLPHDGKVIPQEVAFALAKGARSQGVTIFENARVLDVLHREGRAVGVRTGQGDIHAEIIVLCGGMWTRELGCRCGVSIPLHAVEHHYVVTEPIEGAHDELPVGRDPDGCIYFRGEGDGLVLGAFQQESTVWRADPVPPDFSFQLLEPDWAKFSEPLRYGRHRIPALQHCRFERFVNGPESFTPDNNFLLGETPEMRNLYVAAGFNSVGIASAGGAGKYLAEWILQGEAPLDLASVDIRRFGPWASNRQYLRARVAEVLGLHYQPAWPNREPMTARGVRRSPLHDRLIQAGACFGVKNGWERPNWFARRTAPAACRMPEAPGDFAMKPEAVYGFGRQNWFANHACEHLACRTNVAIFDQSAFGKLRVTGPDALPLLQRLCGNNIDVPVGRVVYTGMFNARGGFESDLTVMRQGPEEFLLITGTAQPIRDRDWLQRHRQPDEHVEIADVTSASAVIGLMGPRSRDLLRRVTSASLDHEAFPFGSARAIDIGMATVWAARITYVGELGWELHVPVEMACLVHDLLFDAGRDLDVIPAGHYAINSLRLEKACRAWGADISPDDTPFEAGLTFAVDWTREFLGRQALLDRKSEPLSRRLVVLVLEDADPVLWGGELIHRNGRTVGYTTSGAYGHSLGRAVGMGYVHDPSSADVSELLRGEFEVQIDGRRYSATAHVRAPHDPERKRVLV